MEIRTIAFKKGACVALVFSAVFGINAASDEALHVLSRDIIVRAQTDNNLRERVASVLPDATIINLPANALLQTAKGLQPTVHDQVCKTLTDAERRDIIGRKFHELLNPTKENKDYSITHYTETVKHICERTNQTQFAQQHASFVKKLSACAQKALQGGLMYLMTNFSKDLVAAFDTLTDQTTKKLVSSIVSAEMTKQGQGHILMNVNGRNKRVK